MVGAFQDSSGRTAFTVYDDGSFTQTLYSTGDMPISGYTENSANPSIAGVLPTIPAGGSETVNIAQRKSTDVVCATIDVYDASGNLVDVYEPQVADALHSNAMTNPHTHYDYDPSGNEVDQIDAKGNETFWTYDENGNEVSRTLPDGETETYTYNQYGQVAKHTDFDGNVANYNYFATGIHAGMLSSVAYNAPSGSTKTSETVSYTYDSLGRTYMITDASGGTTDYYDAQGNLDEQQTPEGTIWYVFNVATGEHTETYTAYTDILYGYNPQGELTSVTVEKLNGTVLGTPLVTAYTYDGAGNKLTETLPDGEVTTYTYDDLNRLIDMVEKQGTTTLFSESLTLNDDGTRATAAETQLQTDGTTSTLNYSWTYDADGRLKIEGLSAKGDAADDDYGDTYTFDLNGNQITDVHTGAGGTIGTTTNTYNGDDQLTDAVVTGGASTHYDYDPNGSQIDIKVNGTITTTNTYDVRNKMVGYSGSGGSATYVYNDAGNRVQETTGGVTTYYLTDTQNPTGYAQPLEEHHGTITSSPFRTYLLGDHAYGQADGSGSVSYLLIDGHGSTQQITNSSGSVTAALAYTAYGTALNFNPAALGGAYFFGGDAVYDPVSGLYMHGDGTRDRMGVRFIQADSQGNGTNGDPISLHKYLYAGGNPVMYDDPSGHDENLAETEGSVGIGALLLTLVAGGALAATLHSAAYTRAASSVASGIEDLISSGEQALVHEGLVLASNTAAVVAAVDKAIISAGVAAVAAWKASASIPPIFPIIRSFGPTIYAFDSRALLTHPWWYVLNYNGPLSPVTAANRASVWTAWGWKMATAPAFTSLDEFPYASTAQGGAGPVPFGALATPVPWLENAVQGGLLSAFYRFSLKGTPGKPFLVVPIPL